VSGDRVLPLRCGFGRRRSLWDIVRHFDARLLLAHMRMLETVSAMHQGQLDSDMRVRAQSIFNEIPEDCINLGLHASKASAEKIVKLLSRDDASFEGLRSLVGELQERMMDEMSASRFFIMSDQEADYYGNPRKGWKEVIVRFPDSVTDIEEAYKCFACSRYAAAVFHSLQVVEVGLIELGKLIAVTDPTPGWTATTQRLKKILDTKYSDRTAFERENYAFLEQLHAATMLSNSRGGTK
jgi:hypothetical protein